MKAETADYLRKARICLSNANTIAVVRIDDVAAREAYLAAFHAAEAYIFEQTGKAPRTHRGVRSEFSRLARVEPSIGRDCLSFLAEGYQYKAIADYGIGLGAGSISAEDAKAAIEAAAHLIETVAALLPP